LSQQLRSKRYRLLKRDWDEFLSSTETCGKEPKRAGLPILTIASRRVWRVYRKIIRVGEKIDNQTPAAQLHRVRIDCKKLRYMMEFFRSIYPPKEIKSLIGALRRLQDNLGDFNDYEVQQDHLKLYGHQMHEAGQANPDTLMAMGRLMHQMAVGQRGEKKQFTTRFAEFASTKNRKRFRRLFAKSKSAGNLK